MIIIIQVWAGGTVVEWPRDLGAPRGKRCQCKEVRQRSPRLCWTRCRGRDVLISTNPLERLNIVQSRSVHIFSVRLTLSYFHGSSRLPSVPPVTPRSSPSVALLACSLYYIQRYFLEYNFIHMW